MWWEGAAYWAAMAMVVYGVLNAVIHIVVLARSLRRRPPGLAYLVLVQDQADWVEGIVRALAREESSDLVLMDLGSVDESGAILERLARDYEHARFLRLEGVERSTALAAGLNAITAQLVVLVDATARLAKKG